MAVSKCYLCNGRLRGGDWKYKELDGKPRKVCVDEKAASCARRCTRKSPKRQKMKKAMAAA